jgi:hypothetical protein
MDRVSGVSAINLTLPIVYLSGVTCFISTCCYDPSVGFLFRHVYPVERVSLRCDL